MRVPHSRISAGATLVLATVALAACVAGAPSQATSSPVVPKAVVPVTAPVGPALVPGSEAWRVRLPAPTSVVPVAAPIDPALTPGSEAWRVRLPAPGTGTSNP
jgi:hypothetical protein